MNKCCESCAFKCSKGYPSTCPCHSQEKEETTTSQAILLDMYEREGLVGIEKHIAKERAQAEKKLLNQVLDIIHETDPSTGRGTSKIYWGNVLREKVSALLPEQESK